MHSGPMTQPPSATGISIGRAGQQEVRKTSVYRAVSHASITVSVG